MSDFLTYLTFALVMCILLLIGYVIYSLEEKLPKSRDVELAFYKVWNGSGMDEKIGRLEQHARELNELHRNLEMMLRVPSERGTFGEMTLEHILKDQLTPDLYGIRKKIDNGRIPDAYIKSTVGLICIDSKFPLTNYVKMMEATTSKDKDTYKKKFLKDVERHLKKIADSYISPEHGTAEFAFAYITSEAVYWYLVNEAFDLLRDFSKIGVQVVSPLTLTHKVDLIKAGIYVQKLSEEAKDVKNKILELSRQFARIDETWKKFHATHLSNLLKTARVIDQEYSELKSIFEEISKHWVK